MKTAGGILKFYRELITECIPLFVAAGLSAALCSMAALTDISCLEQISGGLYGLVIPVMAGYKSGKKCGGDAGGLAGALAASAVLMSGTVSAFTASLLAGCCSGYIYKRGMERLERVIPSGFEMLTGNLHLALSGMAGGLMAYYIFLPLAACMEQVLAGGTARMAESGLLPWSSVLVEPLKILFFNNWLNHGFLLPLGVEQARAAGGSILFLLEENPGPGFGILAALALSRPGVRLKREMTSSLVIQMFGGIHEIYFPYVLADLRLLAAAMAGGIAGNYCFMLTGCRLRGPASPGSIITILLMSDSSHWIALTAGILVSAAVSFGLSWMIMEHPGGTDGKPVEKRRVGTDGKPVENRSEGTDGKPVESRPAGTDGKPVENRPEEPARGRWKAGTMKIYFVCDAGMGSSAMASALFKRKLKAEAIEGMEVFHVSADRIPGDADVLVCQQGFASSLPHTGLPCFTVENLTDMDAYTELLEWLKGDG